MQSEAGEAMQESAEVPWLSPESCHVSLNCLPCQSLVKYVAYCCVLGFCAVRLRFVRMGWALSLMTLMTMQVGHMSVQVQVGLMLSRLRVSCPHHHQHHPHRLTAVMMAHQMLCPLPMLSLLSWLRLLNVGVDFDQLVLMQM